MWMASIDEQILRAAKEIVVKFIETGRLSPSGFPDTFRSVYRTVEKTVRKKKRPAAEPSEPAK
jgi:predicted transcriptional regulator